MTKKKRRNEPKLSKQEIAAICELWVADTPVEDIAADFNISINTVSRYISKYYLGTTTGKTYSITIASGYFLPEVTEL